jgi:hypothetical protein
VEWGDLLSETKGGELTEEWPLLATFYRDNLITRFNPDGDPVVLQRITENYIDQLEVHLDSLLEEKRKRDLEYKKRFNAEVLGPIEEYLKQ